MTEISEPTEKKQIAESISDEKLFTCHLCGLKEKFHYFGSKPPFAKSVTFLEDSYVARDPFAASKQGLFLMLGSDCIMCSQPVCQSQTCSLFYKNRYCIPCAKQHASLPKELQRYFNMK